MQNTSNGFAVDFCRWWLDYQEREKFLLVRDKLLRLFFRGNGAADGVEVGIRVTESLDKELPSWLPTCVGT